MCCKFTGKDGQWKVDIASYRHLKNIGNLQRSPDSLKPQYSISPSVIGFPLKPGHKPQFLASSLLVEVLDFANVMIIYGRGIKEHEVLLKEPKNSVLLEGSLYGALMMV